MYNLQKFIGLADNFYIEDFGFPKVIIYEDMKRELFDYLYNELVLFGTGALVMLSAFQVRLIISYWQYYKHAASRMMEDWKAETTLAARPIKSLVTPPPISSIKQFATPTIGFLNRTWFYSYLGKIVFIRAKIVLLWD